MDIFLKKDLKDGMPVKHRDGTFRVVWLGHLRCNNASSSLKMFKDDLTHKYNNAADIVAVWPIPNGNVTLDDILNPKDEPLWVRREPMRISDVEKEILSNIHKKYKWIAKDKDGAVYVHKDRPRKSIPAECWEGGVCNRLPFENLFNWLSWDDPEPINFRDLINKGGVIFK